MYTQVRSSAHASDGHMYTHVIVTSGHMYTPLLWGWGGGGVIPFMFLCTRRHSNLVIFLAVQQTQALLFHDPLLVGLGGVGWGNNVHVSVHTLAQQPYHLSCCSADTGTTHPCVPLNYCLHFTSLFKLPPLRSTKPLSPFYFFI